jgi:trk system potassium uptake protein TrkA
MRIAIVSASSAAVAAARLLIEHKHEVVIIEKDKDRIDDLSGELDCGFLHGDGTRPRLLREAGPEATDVLLCLSNNDQVNIIASLVGRSLGFGEVVTKISDPEFEHICTELELDNTISADQVTARRLLDMVEGRGVVELSTVLRGDARFVVIPVGDDEAGPASKLRLPADTWVLYGYRNGRLLAPAGDLELKPKDDLVLLTTSGHLQELKERGRSARG